MLRFFKVEDQTLKRHISIGDFVVYIDTGSSMPISPSKSRDLDGMEMIRNNRIIFTGELSYKLKIMCTKGKSTKQMAQERAGELKVKVLKRWHRKGQVNCPSK